jgi:peptidoglycan/xylan/chitin deacetylase (PgdA/CDA1 family)
MTEPRRRPAPDPARRAVLAAGMLALPGLAACTGSTPDRAAPATAAPAPRPTPDPSPSGPAASPAETQARAGGPDITHGPAGAAAVALTFHGAGDAALLTRMLAELAAAGARVTVLAIGQWLAGEPRMARQILDGGHELGNHTWSHQTMPRLTAAQVRVEINRAAAELRTLTGSAGRWFRPSGTPRSTPIIRAAAVVAGYGACLAYDVDPMDYTDPGAAAVLRRFRADLRPGSIVSLHLGHPGTVQAMPAMLDLLASRGLSAVTASQLLGPG